MESSDKLQKPIQELCDETLFRAWQEKYNINNEPSNSATLKFYWDEENDEIYVQGKVSSYGDVVVEPIDGLKQFIDTTASEMMKEHLGFEVDELTFGCEREGDIQIPLLRAKHGVEIPDNYKERIENLEKALNTLVNTYIRDFLETTDKKIWNDLSVDNLEEIYGTITYKNGEFDTDGLSLSFDDSSESEFRVDVTDELIEKLNKYAII